MTTQIGWTLTTESLAIKQGSSGAVQIVCLLTDDAGVDYGAWDCRIVLVSPYTQRAAITLTPAVTGDAGEHTLTAIMEFVPDMTDDLQPGVYVGDVQFSSTPDVFFSANLSLTIQASAS